MSDKPFPPPLDVPGLLRQHGLRPNKRLGQNFLIDQAALCRVVDAAHISSEDNVLEVGPGVGSLTRFLAEVARQVVAVELDGDLIPILRTVLDSYPNVRVIHDDILRLDPSHLIQGANYLVVANIPYYITSSLIRHLLEADLRPRRIVLTVQQEVAERICAAAGKMNLLALSVQVFSRPKVIAHIPAGAFYPPPKVSSSVVHLDLLPQPLIPDALLNTFFQLAKAGFSQKRKTLRNALAAGLGLKPVQAENLLNHADILHQRRAETLSLEEWGKLAQIFGSAPQPQENPAQQP